MRINIKENFEVEINLNACKINYILGPNSSGKTKFCQMLSDGFEGKLNKKFIVDGDVVDKGKYKVFYIKDLDTLDIEASLSAKTQLKNKIKNEYLCLEEEKLILLKQEIEGLNEFIKVNIFEELNLKNIKLNLDINALDLINKFTALSIDENHIDKMSLSQKRYAYINFILEVIQSECQPVILIIDEIQFTMQNRKVKELIARLQEVGDESEIYVFFTSSNYYHTTCNMLYLTGTSIENSLIREEQIVKRIAKEEGCSVRDIYTYYSDYEIEQYVEDNELIKEEIRYLLDKE